MTDSKLPDQNNFKTDIGKSNEPIESNSSQHKGSRQQLVFVLGGSVHEINSVRQRRIETYLRKICGDTQLIVTDIEAERITLKGSLLSLEKLQELFVEGKLLKLLGIPIEYIYFLRHNTKDKYNQSDLNNQEFSLVQDIRENGAFGKDLTNADLKKANLAGADLNGCDS